MTEASRYSPSHPAWRVAYPAAVGSVAIALLVCGFGLWSTQTKLAGAVVASGKVEVQSNKQVVQHSEGGVVGEILTRDGDHVEAGQLLLRLDDTFLSSELVIVERQFFEILARKTRLEAERDEGTEIVVPDHLAALLDTHPEIGDLYEGQRRLLLARAETVAAQVNGLREQAEQLENEILGADAQHTGLNRQLELIGEDLVVQRALLERGLTEASRVKTLEREEARIEGEIGRVKAGIARVRGQIASIATEIVRIRAVQREEANTELRDVGLREVELAERRLTLKERLQRLDVRAPVGGIVFGSQIFARRSVLEPAAPIMYIVPNGAALLIAARVDARSIDQVYVGQTTSLRFPAFNQRQTPEIEGHVVNVSADTLTDERTGVSFYRIEILPDQGQIERLNGQTLLPGMPAESFLRTDLRTPISYLAKPLTDYFAKAFRD